MGFWDTAGTIAKGVANKVKETSDEINLLKEEYREYDDERLKRQWKNSTGLKKAAAAAILRERGYGQNQS